MKVQTLVDLIDMVKQEQEWRQNRCVEVFLATLKKALPTLS
jgi:hypothetical protein